MNLTKHTFALMLQHQLDQGFDVDRLARWAYELHIDVMDFEAGLEPEVLKLVVMSEGPEFAMTEVDIREMIESLCSEI